MVLSSQHNGKGKRNKEIKQVKVILIHLILLSYHKWFVMTL
jgi:hypothetical protein